MNFVIYRVYSEILHKMLQNQNNKNGSMSIVGVEKNKIKSQTMLIPMVALGRPLGF